MRIDRLDLIAYGHFSEKSLDLSGGNSGLHVIYGDNEAGKSTSLRALTALLFGVPSRTSDNYAHSNPKLRIGGKLRLRDGRSLEFVRRKGTKGTLLHHEFNTALEDSILAPYIPGGIDETLFSRLYGIDHSRLVAGGQELLNQAGDIGQALFSAAIGTENLRDIVLELQNDADELFRPQASSKIINQALSLFKSGKKQVKTASLPVSEWKKLQDQHADILSEIEAVEVEMSHRNREKSRLLRVSRLSGARAQRRIVHEHLDELSETLLLPDDFSEKRRAVETRLKAAEETKQKAEAQLKRLVKEADSTQIRTELLENEETILAIYKELGAVEKTIQDRPQQDGKRRLLLTEAGESLKHVRPDIGLDGADTLRPLITHKKWIFNLSQEYELLNQKKNELTGTLKDIGDERDSLKKELSEQDDTGLDLEKAKAAVITARKQGALEQRLVELEKKSSEGCEACRSELARLGKFNRPIEALLQTPMPMPETLDIFENKFDSYNEQRKDVELRVKTFKEDREQALHRLTALLKVGNIPTTAELEELRAVRDKGWYLIRRKYIEGEDVEEDIRHYSTESELSSTYELSVETADQHADQLRLAADQVAVRADLETRIKTAGSQLTALAKERNLIIENTEKIKEKWHKIWESTSVEPDTPRAMKQWLLRVESLLANVHIFTNEADEAQRLREKCNDLKKMIVVHLETIKTGEKTQEMSLESMLNFCEQIIEQEKQSLERRRQLELALNGAEIRHKRTQHELETITRKLHAWSREWSEAIDGLHVTGEIHPTHAVEAFDQLSLFFERFDKAESLRRRIYGMDQVEERFVRKVFDFADSIGWDRRGREAADVAAQLNRDLNEARELRANMKKNVALRKEIISDIEDSQITSRIAEEELASLKEQARVQTSDQLDDACERSEKKRKLLLERDMIEQELIRNGDGLSIAQLEREADQLDSDAIDGDLDITTRELTELQKKRDELRDRRKTVQNEISFKDGHSQAAEALEEVERQRASIVSGTEKYLRLKIAALILEQHIENYRKENQAPVLARAANLFTRLTRGAYGMLRDELDDSGNPVLLGVRQNDDEVRIEGMSEGTRDQLYLSLRLAALEQHLDKAEPLPFIVDDILIGFDDNRTTACLEIFAELSNTTQVLLFTHHRRVVELSSGIDGSSEVFEHHLS